MPADAEVIDYTGYSVAPGLVDTRTATNAGTSTMPPPTPNNPDRSPALAPTRHARANLPGLVDPPR